MNQTTRRPIVRKWAPTGGGKWLPRAIASSLGLRQIAAMKAAGAALSQSAEAAADTDHSSFRRDPSGELRPTDADRPWRRRSGSE
jgi:hypothetical protein